MVNLRQFLLIVSGSSGQFNSKQKIRLRVKKLNSVFLKALLGNNRKTKKCLNKCKKYILFRKILTFKVFVFSTKKARYKIELLRMVGYKFFGLQFHPQRNIKGSCITRQNSRTRITSGASCGIRLIG